MFRPHTIAASLLAVFLAWSPSAGMAQGCVSPGEGRQLLEQGQIMPLPAALQQAGLAGGRIVDAQLCRAGGGYVYRVRVRQDGDVLERTIPAG